MTLTHDESGRQVYWVLRQCYRKIRVDRYCVRCRAYCAIGEIMQYTVHVCHGDFTAEYTCYICAS